MFVFKKRHGDIHYIIGFRSLAVSLHSCPSWPANFEIQIWSDPLQAVDNSIYLSTCIISF